MNEIERIILSSAFEAGVASVGVGRSAAVSGAVPSPDSSAGHVVTLPDNR